LTFSAHPVIANVLDHLQYGFRQLEKDILSGVNDLFDTVDTMIDEALNTALDDIFGSRGSGGESDYMDIS
jgi:hypothetical protein